MNRYFWRALRGILFVTVMLATMEFASRLHDFILYRAPLLSNYDFEKLFYYDGKVVRGVPNARYAKWALNSIGMRGPDPRSPAGQTRVVVYGASEAFGIYESDGHEFPRLLESELNSHVSKAKFELVNAGIPGMRVGSGIEYLQEIGRRLEPSIVLIYPTPTHYIGVRKPHCGRPDRKPSQPNNVEWPASRLLAKSVERAKAILPKPALSIARRSMIALAMRGKSKLQAVDAASLDALEFDMKCAVRQVRAIGAQPVLITHANRFGNKPDVDDGYWLTGWRVQYPELAEDGFIDLEQRANKVISRVAAVEHVQLIDAAVALSGDRANFADHAHFSDRGSARMAQLLSDALVHNLVQKNMDALDKPDPVDSIHAP